MKFLQGREPVGDIRRRHDAQVGDDGRGARLLHRRRRRQVRERRHHQVNAQRGFSWLVSQKIFFYSSEIIFKFKAFIVIVL